MSERMRAVQVGLLFIVSVIVLVAGVLWFRDFRIGQRSYPIHVEFPSTSGLVKGDPVEVKGVSAGRVERIFYEDGRAVVTVELDRGVVLRRGTTATVENVGLMGQKVVSFRSGPESAPALPPDTMIRGEYQEGVPELMVGLSRMLGTFERLALRMDTLLVAFDAEKQRNLALTLDHTEHLTRQLATLLDAHDAELGRSIHDMSTSMAELSRALDGRGEKLGAVIDGTAAVTQRLDSTLVHLDTAVRRVDGVLADVEGNEGTVGKLLRDEALYDEFVITLRDAKSLLQDVREHPHRYFKFSIF